LLTIRVHYHDKCYFVLKGGIFHKKGEKVYKIGQFFQS